MNRVVTGKLTKRHFAPTESARQNLLKESVGEKNIFVTGNTVIDALLSVAEREVPLPFNLDSGKRLILVTAHRRENFGEPFREICRAILVLVEHNEDVHVLYPVYPNPNVCDIAYEVLGNHSRIHALRTAGLSFVCRSHETGLSDPERFRWDTGRSSRVG